MTQKAVALHAGARKATEITVPQSSGEPGSIHAPDYK